MTQQTKQASPNPWADSPEEQEAVAENGGGFSNIVNLKMKVGQNLLRTIGTYKMFRQYWIPAVKRTVIAGPLKDCPVYNHPEKKRLLDQANKLKEAGKKEEAKEIFRQAFGQYEPRVTYAINVLDRADGTIKVWKFSRTMKEQIMDIATQWGDPTEYDLVVTRKGTGKKTKYTVVPNRDSNPLTEAEKKLRVHNLSKLYQPTAIEKVQAYLRGEIPAKKAGGNTAPQEETASVEKAIIDDVELPEDLESLGNFE